MKAQVHAVYACKINIAWFQHVIGLTREGQLQMKTQSTDGVNYSLQLLSLRLVESRLQFNEICSFLDDNMYSVCKVDL